MKIDFAAVDSILQNHDYAQSKVIGIMQDLQKEYSYLPEEALKYIADKIGMSYAKIYGVATFYGNFSLESKGKYVIKCCNGTACHVNRTDDVQDALWEAVGMKPGQHTSEDGIFTIERVSCLGACGLAPTVMVNDTVYGKMTPEKMRKLVSTLREESKYEN